MANLTGTVGTGRGRGRGKVAVSGRGCAVGAAVLGGEDVMGGLVVEDGLLEVVVRVVHVDGGGIDRGVAHELPQALKRDLGRRVNRVP